MSDKAKRSSDSGSVWGSHGLRRGVVTVAGGLAAALLGLGFAETIALKPIKPVEVAHASPRTVIDGPPTDVEPAPPPVPPHRAHARPDPDDDVDVDSDPELAAMTGPPPGAAPPGAFAGPGRAGADAPAGPPDAASSGDRCAQLPSPADRLVCANPSLSAADATEEGLFRMALADSDQPDALRAEQRRWRAARDRAAASGGPDGLAAIYDARINELRGPG